MPNRLSSIIALVALTLAAALPGVFTLPVLDRDEARFAQASLQMMETGDYVQINVQDEPRNKKPVGIHWMQVAAVTLFSDVADHEIWAYRLPSVLGALIAVFATYWAGVTLLGRRAAFAGAALLAVSLLLGVEAGIAKTDAMLVGLTALSMAALARVYRGGRAGPSFVFWAALGAAILIKGPIAPMVAGLAIITLVLLDRRGGWLLRLLYPLGPIAAIAIVAPWVWAIQTATDGAFLTEALSGDLFPKLAGGHESHGAPPGTHLALLPILFWPGTLFLVPGLFLAFRALGAPGEEDDPARPGLRFLFAWAAPAWLVFELMPTKLVHYPLPLYPALALMAGAAFAALSERRALVGGHLLSTVLFAAIGAVLACVTLILPAIADMIVASGQEPDGDMALAAIEALGRPEQIAIAILSGALLLAPFILWRATAAKLAFACLAGIALHWTLLGYVAPRLDALFISQRVSEELQALALHPRLSSGVRRPLVTLGYREQSLVFETETDTVLAETADEAAAIMAAEAGRAAVVEEGQREAFEEALAALGAEAVVTGGRVIEGLNYSTGEPVRLIIYRTVRRGRGRDAHLRIQGQTE